MQKMQKSRGAANQQVGRAGEYFVVAELNKRGAFAVPFAGNMPKIDLIACNHTEPYNSYSSQNQTRRANMAFKYSG